MHNVEYEIWSRLAKNSTNPVKSIYFRMLSRSLKLYEKRLLAKADIVSCVSPDDIQKFKLLSSKPVYYLAPAGVNLRYWEFHPSYSYFKWYHLGSLEWQANKEAVTWFLDEIFPQLYADFGISFHLGGKGINPSDYMSHNISINSRIEEANQFVYPLDVCVVPLLSGSGIRLKILEAMAAGKLVISTKVGAQGIDAEHGKQLLLANNQSEFRALLKELHSGKYDLKWIINNARKLVEEKYSIAAVSSSLIKLYTKFQADHHRE
jgi:glycosyltransferase involved in cell wall biosynthesis